MPKLGTVVVALALLATGCTTLPLATGDEQSRPTAPPAALATEQRYLEDWFKGTPVAISLHGSGPLVVEVPLVHSFDPGSATPKRALGAVLDRVAESLRRQRATRVSVAAPADLSGSGALAQARTAKVREALTGRGVAGTRVSAAPTDATAVSVQLRISMIAAPISRLDDSTLPPPPPPKPR